MYDTVGMNENGPGFGAGRLRARRAFSPGLILVVAAGAELFTGNNLIVMVCVDLRIPLLELARNRPGSANAGRSDRETCETRRED